MHFAYNRVGLATYLHDQFLISHHLDWQSTLSIAMYIRTFSTWPLPNAYHFRLKIYIWTRLLGMRNSSQIDFVIISQKLLRLFLPSNIWCTRARIGHFDTINVSSQQVRLLAFRRTLPWTGSRRHEEYSCIGIFQISILSLRTRKEMMSSMPLLLEAACLV